MTNKKKFDDDFSVSDDVDFYGLANIQQYKSEVGFKTLVQSVEDNVYVVPDFQRVFRWNEKQVENLAISLFRGMPIPPIYTYRNKKNQLEILDGQQRILSLYFYFIGKYTRKERNNQIRLQKITQSDKPFQEALEETYGLKDKRYYMRYFDIVNEQEIEKVIDITYNDLPKEVKRKLDYTTITIIEIHIDNLEFKKRYLYKIFANLNAGGEPLTKQEIRNGIYKSDFYDMLFEFNNVNAKWRKLYGNEDKFSKDIEFLLRFCALKYFVEFKENKFVIGNYKNYTKMLDDFSEKSVLFGGEEINEYKASLEKFVDAMSVSIPKKVTLWESLFTVMDKKGIYIEISKDFYSEIQKNKNYSKTTKDSTASKSGLETRLNAVYDEFSKYVNDSCK